MVLKPQDVVVLLKLALNRKEPWSYPRLAVELGMSPSEVHQAVRRAKAAGLLVSSVKSENGRSLSGLAPNHSALAEFIVHGLKYAFIAERGGETRGLPTAHAAPPLNKKIVQSDPLPPVWPAADGPARGLALSPLYPSVPAAARRDSKLYEILALIDALRCGRARERTLAKQELLKRLNP